MIESESCGGGSRKRPTATKIFVMISLFSMMPSDFSARKLSYGGPCEAPFATGEIPGSPSRSLGGPGEFPGRSWQGGCHGVAEDGSGAVLVATWP